MYDARFTFVTMIGRSVLVLTFGTWNERTAVALNQRDDGSFIDWAARAIFATF